MSRRPAAPPEWPSASTRSAAVDALESTQRLLLHGRVNPSQASDVEGMDELAETYGIAAWKTYTQWGPDGKGCYLTDDVASA